MFYYVLLTREAPVSQKQQNESTTSIGGWHNAQTKTNTTKAVAKNLQQDCEKNTPKKCAQPKTYAWWDSTLKHEQTSHALKKSLYRSTQMERLHRPIKKKPR